MSLSHDLSIEKIQVHELDCMSLKLIYGYINERKQRIKIGDLFSPWTDLLFDVPQWSILEQLLFNIFLCDLFLLIRDLDIASYVDDNMPYDICGDIDEIISDLKHAATSLSI